MVHVIVDGDVVWVGAVATSSLHDTFNSAESRATPLAAFIVLMSVMAEANQKLFSMTNQIQARQVDGDASSLRGSESIEVRLILFERPANTLDVVDAVAVSSGEVGASLHAAAVFTLVVVTQSVPDGCTSPIASITVVGTKAPPTAVSVTLIVPYVDVVNE